MWELRIGMGVVVIALSQRIVSLFVFIFLLVTSLELKAAPGAFTFSFQVLSSTQTRVSWTTATGSAVYRIRYGIVNGGSGITKKVSAPTLGTVLEGLSPGRRYYISVYADATDRTSTTGTPTTGTSSFTMPGSTTSETGGVSTSPTLLPALPALNYEEASNPSPVGTLSDLNPRAISVRPWNPRPMIEEFQRLESTASIVYVAPTSRGTGTGTDSANAAAFSTITARIQTLTRPAKFIFTPGDYYLRTPENADTQIFIGAPDASGNINSTFVVLEALSGAYLRGQYDFLGEARSRSGIFLYRGNLVLRNFRAENLGYLVSASPSHQVNNVLIEGVVQKNSFRGVFMDRYRGRATNWYIRNSKFLAYYEFAIRVGSPYGENFAFENLYIDGGGHGRHRVSTIVCSADSGSLAAGSCKSASSSTVRRVTFRILEESNECFKGGIQMYKGVKNVSIRKAVIKNVLGCVRTYRQGDAIEADDKGDATTGTQDQSIPPENILIEDVHLENAADGVIDLKARNVHLKNVNAIGVRPFVAGAWNNQDEVTVDCRTEYRDPVTGNMVYRTPSGPNTFICYNSMRAGNRHNFKVWNYNYLCDNCYGIQSSVGTLNINRARLHFRNSKLMGDANTRPGVCKWLSKGISTSVNAIAGGLYMGSVINPETLIREPHGWVTFETTRMTRLKDPSLPDHPTIDPILQCGAIVGGTEVDNPSYSDPSETSVVGGQIVNPLKKGVIWLDETQSDPIPVITGLPTPN